MRNRHTKKLPLYLDLFWLAVYPPPVRVSPTGETNALASPSLLMGSPAEESNNNSDLPPLIFQRTKMIFWVSKSHLLPGIQPEVVACTCLSCLWFVSTEQLKNTQTPCPLHKEWHIHKVLFTMGSITGQQFCKIFSNSNFFIGVKPEIKSAWLGRALAQVW